MSILFVFRAASCEPHSTGIRDLGISSAFYEILVLGSSMKLPGDNGIAIFIINITKRFPFNSHFSYSALCIDIRYICDKCPFTDKIREAFAQSSMETVYVMLVILLQLSHCGVQACGARLHYCRTGFL
jgi:hypothetical protein